MLKQLKHPMCFVLESSQHHLTQYSILPNPMVINSLSYVFPMCPMFYHFIENMEVS